MKNTITKNKEKTIKVIVTKTSRKEYIHGIGTTGSAKNLIGFIRANINHNLKTDEYSITCGDKTYTAKTAKGIFAIEKRIILELFC